MKLNLVNSRASLPNPKPQSLEGPDVLNNIISYKIYKALKSHF